ncbi:uncharacterized protein LOC143062077 [Mytilus galloprovincialis]|uniref:uncharacterized protein LOC143062077 n=1 Tax=Mytilus galloprovincialis TaxID=29158 RepID=UPI003F7C6FC8
MDTFFLFMLLQHTVHSFDIHCPVGKQWHMRARAKCGISRYYTCLLNHIKGIYKESCNGPDWGRRGHKLVINGDNLDRAQCLYDRYQPFHFDTTEESHCVYKKDMCNNEGQVVYNKGSAVQDRRCRCDHTKGYSFVKSTRKDVCSCSPTYDDCSCYHTRCKKGYILSPDYFCILIDEYSNQRFLCTDVPVAKKYLPDRIFKKTKERQIKDLSKKVKLKVCIGASSLIFVLLGVFGVFYCSKRRMKDVKSNPEKVISNIIPTGTNQTELDDIEMDDSLYEAIDERQQHTMRIETVNNPTLGLNEDVNSSTDDDDDHSSYLNPYNSLLKEPSDYHIYEKI